MHPRALILTALACLTCTVLMLLQTKGRMLVTDVQKSEHWPEAMYLLKGHPLSKGGPVENGMQVLHSHAGIGGSSIFPEDSGFPSIYLGAQALPSLHI